MLIAILAIATLAALFGLLLGYSAIRFPHRRRPHRRSGRGADAAEPVRPMRLSRLPALCRGRRQGEAEINLCIPGGEATMLELADLLGREPVEMGEIVEKPKAKALIDEKVCIGCTKCLQSCPVDAIVGATKQLHAIINSECTGCELCVPLPGGVHPHGAHPGDLATWKWPYPGAGQRRRPRPVGAGADRRRRRTRRRQGRLGPARGGLSRPPSPPRNPLLLRTPAQRL
jgi:electron transport complex protein RnfB